MCVCVRTGTKSRTQDKDIREQCAKTKGVTTDWTNGITRDVLICTSDQKLLVEGSGKYVCVCVCVGGQDRYM